MNRWAAGAVVGVWLAATPILSPVSASLSPCLPPTTTTSTLAPAPTAIPDEPAPETTTTTVDEASTTTSSSVVQEAEACGPGVAIATAPEIISPAFPLSVDSFDVVAQVTVVDGLTLGDLQTVSMCWYLISSLDCNHSDEAPLDPRYALSMVWTEDSETADGASGFAMVGTGAHEASPSHVSTTPFTPSYDKSQTSMTIRFSFKVSGAMSASKNWSVLLVAQYDDAGIVPASAAHRPVPVGYASSFTLAETQSLVGSMTTDPTLVPSTGSPSFGMVAPGGSREVMNIVRGSYLANGPTEYRLAGNDFCSVTLGCEASQLNLVGTATPGQRQVSLACGSSQLSLLYRSGEAQTVAELRATGTKPENLPPLTCVLSYGGGSHRALDEHAGSVTVTLERLITE